MGANIQIKYEIALSRVHFLTQIALYSVHLILLYAHVYIFFRKKSHSLIFTQKARLKYLIYKELTTMRLLGFSAEKSH